MACLLSHFNRNIKLKVTTLVLPSQDPRPKVVQLLEVILRLDLIKFNSLKLLKQKKKSSKLKSFNHRKLRQL